MATYNGRNLTPVSGLNITSRSGVIRFETPDLTPVTTSGERVLYVDSSNNLKYDNGSSVVTIAAATGAGLPTFETLFAGDATFTITPDTTFTIAGNRATATDVVTITNIAGGSGSCLQITNSGSGNDIDGTSNTWGVTSAGVLSCAGLTLTGANTITTSSGDITWTLEDNDATALAIGASGATSMMTFVTTNGAEAVVFGNALTVTDGVTTLGSTSNAAAALIIQNDTITTFGNGTTEDQGMVVLSSDTLTTGNLLRLQLDESALNGGAFLKCVQTDAGAAVFTVAENGVTTIAGAGGSNALVVTAGDVVFSDASIALTDADNAASFTVTNNTATTASVVVVAGSGTFTGTTTSSFMTVTPSGLTTGTGIYMPLAALTTGTALSIVPGATMTTGTGLDITTTGTVVTTGELVNLVANSATTCTGLLRMSGTGLTDGWVGQLTGGGANATASGGVLDLVGGAATAGSVLRVTTTGVYTGTTGVVDINAASATTGVVVDIGAAGLTTGTALKINAVEATLTTGKYIDCYDGAASDFKVEKYGATTIAGSASGTAALTVTAGDIVITSGFLVLSANAKGVSFTGTGANGGVLLNLKNAAASALSGVQKDIEISIGGVPYFFTVYPTKA